MAPISVAPVQTGAPPLGVDGVFGAIANTGANAASSPSGASTAVSINGTAGDPSGNGDGGQGPAVDLSEFQRVLDELERDKGKYLPSLNPRTIMEDIRNGNVSLSVGEVFRGVMGYLFQEVLSNTALLGELIILAVVVAVLNHFQSSFESGAVSKVAFAVGYMVLITIAIHSFHTAIQTGRGAIEDMVRFMQAILPVLLTLLTAMGGFASGALFHPVIFGTITLISTLIKDWIFPLILFSAALGILNHVSPQFKVKNLQNLIKDGYKLAMGLFITVFLGVISIYGAVGAVADGVTLRTAKYATDALLPVVGGLVADSFEVIVNSSLLLKNGIGLIGLVIIAILCILPSLKILALVLIYRLAGALLQPIGDSPVADSLETIGGSLTLIFGAVASVGLMFFLALTIVVGAGNLTVMLR
ncbi:stage III sporulation protein AE [Heliomicrobium undosum]|uniref:stage III sporulation protein AE n=1 Tax=Heliomicrobium undosum TaxID=121734 RepID=UPI002E2BACDB|nr:stage III sporulation protein AE [Heliomicrobium undosum]